MQKVFDHDLNINGIHLKSKIMSIFKSCTLLYTMKNTLTTSNSCSFHIANVISTKYHNQHDTKTEEKDLKYFYHESIVLLMFLMCTFGKPRVDFYSIFNDQYKVFSIAIIPFTNDIDWQNLFILNLLNISIFGYLWDELLFAKTCSKCSILI